MNTRRRFLTHLVASAGMPALLCGRAFAQTPPPPVKLEESDPVATALGYKEDTTKVDGVKYPLHKPDQKCVNCALYQTKPGEASGPCAAFGGKLVTEAGWCSVYAKKPEPVKP
jgi:hypothetical protein